LCFTTVTRVFEGGGGSAPPPDFVTLTLEDVPVFDADPLEFDLLLGCAVMLPVSTAKVAGAPGAGEPIYCAG